MPLHALCIISKSSVNSKWSYNYKPAAEFIWDLHAANPHKISLMNLQTDSLVTLLGMAVVVVEVGPVGATYFVHVCGT